MAAMRARRGGSRGAAPPPPPPRGVSKLARIKLEGGAAFAQAARPKPRRKGVTLAGVLLVGGAAIAGASWIGGSLFDTREAVYAGADGIATAMGMRATLDVRGVEGERKKEVERAALPRGRVSIVAAGPDHVKRNVEGLDWVESARVERLWPSTLRITVERRDAFALWEENGVLTVVDAAGERVHGAKPSDYPDLMRIVGAGAGPAAEPVLVALEDLPLLRARLSALVRVNERRWDVSLRDGAVVMLPETDPAAALRRLEALQQRYQVLDRRYARIDLRQDGRLVVQPAAVIAAAPARGA